MKKVLIIGSTVVDIIVNLVDSLPKTGEDVHIRSQHMSLGGCAYNVSDSCPPISRFPISSFPL